MFFHILKKDLKRGRTMNTIILLFIIISVMFISGSVNSMISVTSSLDNYFEKAGIPEVMCATYNRTETQTVEQVLEKDTFVKVCGCCEWFELCRNTRRGWIDGKED